MSHGDQKMTHQTEWRKDYLYLEFIDVPKNKKMFKAKENRKKCLNFVEAKY